MDTSSGNTKGSQHTDSLDRTFALHVHFARPLTAFCTAGVVSAQTFQTQRAAILRNLTSLIGQTYSIN